MNFIDVLNAATVDLSDNKLSKKLGISRQSVSLWRNGDTIPKDEMLEKLAKLTGLPVRSVFCAAYAEKIQNPMVSALLRDYSEREIAADNNPN